MQDAIQPQQQPTHTEKNPHFLNRSDKHEKSNTPSTKQNTFSSTYYHHRKLKPWELWMDDIKFKLREMRQPLHTWSLRHFFALYVLQRFVVRPVLYLPGIMSFYCFQPGRRLNRIWRSVPFKLPKLMAEPFWVSGSEQGFMRFPWGGYRWKEACGDWAVFLGLTWPLWLWTRLYYSYFIIEYCRWRVDIKPTLTAKDSMVGNQRLGQTSPRVEVQRAEWSEWLAGRGTS